MASIVFEDKMENERLYHDGKIPVEIYNLANSIMNTYPAYFRRKYEKSKDIQALDKEIISLIEELKANRNAYLASIIRHVYNEFKLTI